MGMHSGQGAPRAHCIGPLLRACVLGTDMLWTGADARLEPCASWEDSKCPPWNIQVHHH